MLETVTKYWLPYNFGLIENGKFTTEILSQDTQATKYNFDIPIQQLMSVKIYSQNEVFYCFILVARDKFTSLIINYTTLAGYTLTPH